MTTAPVTTVHIRPATAADETSIVAFNACLADESEERTLDRDVLRQGVRALLDDPALGRYFVADVGGEVVGQIMLTREWSDWRNAVFWWIQSVYVSPAWRGRGVFRALFEHVDTLSRSTPGVCGLRLYVESTNVRAQRVYRGCGLVLTDYLIMEIDRSGAIGPRDHRGV